MDFVVEEDLRAHLTCWYIQKYVKENPHPHYLEHIIHWERYKQDEKTPVADWVERTFELQGWGVLKGTCLQWQRYCVCERVNVWRWQDRNYQQLYRQRSRRISDVWSMRGWTVVCFVNKPACFYSTNDFVVMGSTCRHAKAGFHAYHPQRGKKIKTAIFVPSHAFLPQCLEVSLWLRCCGAQNTRTCKKN